MTGIGNGGAVLGKLKRRKNAVRLTDGSLHRITDTPHGPGIVRVVCLVGHVAHRLDQLDAGAGAEAVGMGIFAHLVDTEIVAHGIEEEVADKAEELAFSTKIDLENETSFTKVKQNKQAKKTENTTSTTTQKTSK